MKQNWMTAVFCVADIPSKTMDKLIHDVEERAKRLDGRLGDNLGNVFILTTKEPPKDPQPSTRPFKDVKAPFKGMSFEGLATEHKRLCREPWTSAGEPTGPFLAFAFIVLDERSVEDGTCLLIGTSPKVTVGRAPFALSNTVFVGVEHNNERLDWQGDDVKDPQGSEIPLMTIEVWERSYSAPENQIEYLD